jgi:serine/threonine protein kinase
MTPERWEQVGQLYQAALELRPAERTAFLRQTCGEDESLYLEVESLLAAEEKAADFLAAGAIDDAARALAKEKSFSPVGKRLGHYQVRSLLGAGGMGEVYLAQDTKLDRAVALKFLPSEFAADKDRMVVSNKRPGPRPLSTIPTSDTSMRSGRRKASTSSRWSTSTARRCATRFTAKRPRFLSS